MSHFHNKLSDVLIHRQVVQSYDIDFFQHVNNAVYMNYLEAARLSFLKHYGINFDTFMKQDALPVVATAKLDYKRPCFMDEVLSIHTWICDRKRVSLTFAYEIYNSKNVLAHSAETVLVFVNGLGKATEIPELYVNILKHPEN